METTGNTERITGLRIVAQNNYTCRDEQFMIEDTQDGEIALEDVAIFLDNAEDEAVEHRGNSGSGAGAHMEVLFNGDDPDDEGSCGETIESIADAQKIDPSLVFGPSATRALRKHINGQARSSVWDGNNHIRCCTDHSYSALAMIRAK